MFVIVCPSSYERNCVGGGSILPNTLGKCGLFSARLWSLCIVVLSAGSFILAQRVHTTESSNTHIVHVMIECAILTVIQII